MPEKILIVDDDLESLKLIGLMLQRRGYQIVAAHGGTQALGTAESEQPDLVILDIMMSAMDGYEVTRRMRANNKTSHIPIIMFTAQTLLDGKASGIEAGADEYLTKPIHPVELASRVEAVLLGSARARIDGTAAARAHIIGFLGVKGGVGTTTLAINTAVAIMNLSADESPKRISLAEIHSSAGDIAIQLGLTGSDGLTSLLSGTLNDITSIALDKTLVGHVSGARLLVANAEERSIALNIDAAHSEIIVKQLASVSDVVLLDLGTRLDEGVNAALNLCSRVVICLEPQRVSVTLAQSLLVQLASIGMGDDRVSLVVVNRTQSAASLGKSVIEDMLGRELVIVIPPAPELAFQSADKGEPMISIQPDNIVSDQIRKLAKFAMMDTVG